MKRFLSCLGLGPNLFKGYGGTVIGTLLDTNERFFRKRYSGLIPHTQKFVD